MKIVQDVEIRVPNGPTMKIFHYTGSAFGDRNVVLQIAFYQNKGGSFVRADLTADEMAQFGAGALKAAAACSWENKPQELAERAVELLRRVVEPGAEVGNAVLDYYGAKTGQLAQEIRAYLAEIDGNAPTTGQDPKLAEAAAAAWEANERTTE